MPPGTRSAQFTVKFDPGTIPRWAPAMYPAFKYELTYTLDRVCDSIIDTVAEMLVPLQAEHVPYDNVMGGFDTGKMLRGLKATLLEHMTTGVFYALGSPDADYWTFVNFGHFYHTAEGPKWWEGYHFWERAVQAHQGEIVVACRLAWHRAALSVRAGVGAGPVGSINATLLSALSASQQGPGG